MNFAEGTSGAAGQFEEEKPKTFKDYLNEASKLYYEVCQPSVESCGRHGLREILEGTQIRNDLDDVTLKKKAYESLKLHEDFHKAMSICQAKDSLDLALELGNTRPANRLKDAITPCFNQVTGTEFQCKKAAAAIQRAILVRALSARHEAVAKNVASGSAKQIDRLNAFDDLKKKLPSADTCLGDAIKECINYEKQFYTDPSSEKNIALMRGLRQNAQQNALAALGVEVERRIRSINVHEYCISARAKSTRREIAIQVPDEAIDQSADLLEKAVKSVRDIIDFDELLSDPQTLQMDPATQSVRLSSDDLNNRLNQLTNFQTTLAFWRSTELVKRAGASKIDEDTRENILRIDAAVRTSTEQIMDCYPNIVMGREREPHSERERAERLGMLAKCYEFLACECHRMTGGVRKKNAETLLKLGDALSGAAEGISKELEIKRQHVLIPDSDVREFIDRLFEVKEERDIQGEEESLKVEGEGPSRKAAEEISDDEAANLEESMDGEERGAERQETTDETERETAYELSPGTKEESKVARLAQEVESNKKEKARKRKAIDKDKRQLEKIEKKLNEKIERVDEIKRAFKEGAHVRYLAWDLENAPKEAANYAEFAKRRALKIAAVLEGLEDLSITKGAVSWRGDRKSSWRSMRRGKKR